MPIISAQRLRECQNFIDKVGEIRFNKVKQRQLNKFNLLTIRKEGNITRPNNTNININNLTIQAGSQINQTTSQANPPPAGEGSIPSQASTLLPREASTSLATATSPGEASTAPATATLPREGSGSSQATALLPREASTSLATATSPGEASTSPATATIPREGSSSSQATTLSPGKEAVHPNQVLLITKTGQAGKTIGSLIVTGSPRLPRRIAPSPRKTIILPPHRSPPPKILFRKNLTLSGSLTSPANL